MVGARPLRRRWTCARSGGRLHILRARRRAPRRPGIGSPSPPGRSFFAGAVGGAQLRVIRTPNMHRVLQLAPVALLVITATFVFAALSGGVDGELELGRVVWSLALGLLLAGGLWLQLGGIAEAAFEGETPA